MSSSPELTIAGAPVHIDQDPVELVRAIGRICPESTVHLICDSQTVDLCLPLLGGLSEISSPPIVIPAGEPHKHLRTCEAVWTALAQRGADRGSLIVNIGGGVVTDLGGFCAATYMRGVRFIHVPTTLLGMCDAAHGGKQGVDLDSLKNYVGVFTQPEMIWIDTRFLSTVPNQHLHNGMAEVVKHAIIGDATLFDELEHRDGNLQEIRWGNLVRQAVAVKKVFIEGDIREHGIRAALNFGHTLGHAIESDGLTRQAEMLHGECVATGIILETWISHKHFGTPDIGMFDRITALVNKWTPVEIQRKVNFEDLMPYLIRDKKGKRGVIVLALIRGIAEPVTGVEIPIATLRNYLTDPKIQALVPWLNV